MHPRTMPKASSTNETSPLLGDQEANGHEDRILVELSKEDKNHPRSWSKWNKFTNLAIIASMAILSPLASSMFTPGADKIAESLHASRSGIIGCQSGFVIMLGIGPLILAPLSETFGRKMLYVVCFSIFTLLQIPTALAKSLPVLIFLRALAGFFGSVGIANGGGTISDMYEPNARAGIFGWYLLGPLLGPSLGPLLGGVVLDSLDWPWLFWIFLIICIIPVLGAIFFLKETYVPVLLARRKQQLEQNDDGRYYFEGEDDRPLSRKLIQAMQRPLRILFTQPIVFIMALYQGLIFATTYSLYTQFESIYGGQYAFSTIQIGLIYLGPGVGFLLSVWFLVPKIDTIYIALTKKHDGKSKPEFRLPLANVGATTTPITLFWFAWTIEYKVHWTASVVALFIYGLGQVTIFNATQNYYIDSFEKYAASAIAAGALFRSLVGGVVPLIMPGLLERLGYGWGFSIFAFISVILGPSPLLFYYYGGWLREKFEITLD